MRLPATTHWMRLSSPICLISPPQRPLCALSTVRVTTGCMGVIGGAAGSTSVRAESGSAKPRSTWVGKRKGGARLGLSARRRGRRRAAPEQAPGWPGAACRPLGRLPPAGPRRAVLSTCRAHARPDRPAKGRDGGGGLRHLDRERVGRLAEQPRDGQRRLRTRGCRLGGWDHNPEAWRGSRGSAVG